MRTRRDVRVPVVLATLVLIGVVGYLIRMEPSSDSPRGETPDVLIAPTPNDGAMPAGGTLPERFERAVVALQSRQPVAAERELRAIIARHPHLPEAHVNLGYALLGQGRSGQALEHFERAIDLRPGQANAYFGLAEALEGVGDLPAALGAMRTWIHLVPSDDRRLPRARAALWEWQAALSAVPAER